MFDLIYAGKDVEGIIKKQYPNVKITDASDYIHTERFEMELENVSEDEFYPFAIKKGFIRGCLGFELHFESLRFPEPKNHPEKHKETAALIKKWIELSKTITPLTPQLKGGDLRVIMPDWKPDPSRPPRAHPDGTTD